jgi:hypothetical protein
MNSWRGLFRVALRENHGLFSTRRF